MSNGTGNLGQGRCTPRIPRGWERSVASRLPNCGVGRLLQQESIDEIGEFSLLGRREDAVRVISGLGNAERIGGVQRFVYGLGGDRASPGGPGAEPIVADVVNDEQPAGCNHAKKEMVVERNFGSGGVGELIESG
jgi:hypothetical protein